MDTLDGFSGDDTLYAEIEGADPETLTANTDVDGDGDLDAEVHHTSEGNVIAYTDLDDDGRVDVIAGFDPDTGEPIATWHADESGLLIRDDVPDATGSAAPVVPTDEAPTDPQPPADSQDGQVVWNTGSGEESGDINIDLNHDGVDDGVSWRNDDGSTTVILDADGDGQADVGGVYDEQGRLIDTAHPDDQGVLTSDEQITPAAFPGESFAVDPQTGDWTTTSDH